MKVGDRVKIISVPDCCREDLGKYGSDIWKVDENNEVTYRPNREE